MKVDEIKVT